MNRYLPALDALRFLAALLVVAFHCLYYFGLQDAAAGGPAALLAGGWIGVDIFFVISGLVVTMAALRVRERSPQQPVREFLTHRLVRIVPLYLVTCVAYLLLVDAGPVSGADALRQIASHLSFTHNLWPDTSTSINPPSWSLANEMQLYLLLILLLPWLASWRPRTVLFLAFAVALAYRALVFVWVDPQAADHAAALQHYSYVTPGMVDSFGAGVAMALWLVSAPTREASSRTARLAWVGVALLAGVLCLYVAASATAAVLDGSIWQQPARAIPLRTLIAVPAAIVVLALVRTSLGARPGNHAAMRHAGDLSYGIYLWHATAIVLAARHVEGPAGLRIAVAVALTLILSELTWRLVERPAMRWLRPTAPVSLPGGTR